MFFTSLGGEPLGLENGGIPDDHITASSSAGPAPPHLARLNGLSAWCAGKAEDSFLQVKFIPLGCGRGHERSSSVDWGGGELQIKIHNRFSSYSECSGQNADASKLADKVLFYSYTQGNNKKKDLRCLFFKIVWSDLFVFFLEAFVSVSAIVSDFL